MTYWIVDAAALAFAESIGPGATADVGATFHYPNAVIGLGVEFTKLEGEHRHLRYWWRSCGVTLWDGSHQSGNIPGSYMQKSFSFKIKAWIAPAARQTWFKYKYLACVDNKWTTISMQANPPVLY